MKIQFTVEVDDLQLFTLFEQIGKSNQMKEKLPFPIIKGKQGRKKKEEGPEDTPKVSTKEEKAETNPKANNTSIGKRQYQSRKNTKYVKAWELFQSGLNTAEIMDEMDITYSAVNQLLEYYKKTHPGCEKELPQAPSKPKPVEQKSQEQLDEITVEQNAEMKAAKKASSTYDTSRVMKAIENNTVDTLIKKKPRVEQKQ